MASRLKDLSPIYVRDRWLPTPELFTNIPMLHQILEEVVGDWLRAVEPYQSQVDDADSESMQLYAVLSLFAELPPVFLKCLFSYAFLFVATEGAYEVLYRGLNKANDLSGLRLRHRKPPKRTPFVCKMRMIRNIAIAHFPSDKPDAITAGAAMSWQTMGLSHKQGERPNVEKLTFGLGRSSITDASGRTMESQDLEVPGVKTAHYDHCLPYLEEYDEICCEYLQALQAELPRE